MSKLLIGWPLEPAKDSKRMTFKAAKASLRGDFSHAKVYEQEGHLITFAPAGAGKGVSVIIPNLLHFDGPVITVDPKGENFAVTAGYRKRVLGQRIFLLDPFNFVGQETLDRVGVKRACLNPLDLISFFGSDIETQLTMMASLFRSGTTAEKASNSSGNGDFWDLEAQKLIAGALGLAIDRAKIEKKPPDFGQFINSLYSDDTLDSLEVALETIGEKLSGITYKSISAFTQKADKERSGVLSTAHSYLNIFLPQSIQQFLSSSSISPEDLSTSEDYTIYIVIPPAKLVSHSGLFKLLVSTLLNMIMERTAHPEKKTLFLLDECAQLGTLDGLRKAVTLLRGYGLQVWMFFQDFSQLTSLYESDYQTLINNCGVFQAFGIARNSSAAPILSVIGTFKPEQLTALDRTQQVVSITNEDPRILKRFDYRKDPVFKDMYDDNPLHKRTNTRKQTQVYPFPINYFRFKL